MSVGEPIVYSSQRDRQLALLLHSGFLLVGIVHTLLGLILPMPPPGGVLMMRRDRCSSRSSWA
jgi:hypothetical protein